MNIKETAKQVHQIAKDHGFWEDTELLLSTSEMDEKPLRSMVFAQKLALIHSELSEALEADRKDKRANITGYINWPNKPEEDDSSQWALQENELRFKSTVKDTVEDEIADAVIRIMDLCEWMNIDLEWHIEKKIQYNNMRPYKHGKSY